jgi:hypothetical protein
MEEREETLTVAAVAVLEELVEEMVVLETMQTLRSKHVQVVTL